MASTARQTIDYITCNPRKKYLSGWDVIATIDDLRPHTVVSYEGDVKLNGTKYAVYSFTDANTGKDIKDNETLQDLLFGLQLAYPKALIEPVKIGRQYAPELVTRCIAVSSY